MQLKNPIQKQVLKIYHEEFACFGLDDKHLKIYTYTHSHIHTQGSWTSDVLELYLNTAGLNGEEFSHRRERHIEYTVYVQQKKKTSTLTQLYCRVKNKDQDCKPSLMENK